MLRADKHVLKVLLVTDAGEAENTSQGGESPVETAPETTSEVAGNSVIRPGLVGIHEHPIPSGAELQWIENGGVSIRCARWAATAAPGKGTVCIIQGRTEYIEKYFEVIEDLRGRGFAVLAFDFRGQGGSDRLLRQAWRGHVDNFSDYVSDLERVTREVLLPECPAPFFALAHSTGGA
ncbi:MAG: alpha/beta hydrolase, partial [Rhizobiales bacterium]|nr:alpha/beta hydrolase [Hyphomicrobiales bacterium]